MALYPAAMLGIDPVLKCTKILNDRKLQSNPKGKGRFFGSRKISCGDG
jgi:hypothetical protein